MNKILGDSHAVMFEEKGIHCGAKTAYKLKSHKEDIINKIKENGISNNDEYTGFIFGEIDCRIHLWHQYKKTNVNPFNLMIETIKNYFEFISELEKEQLIGEPIIFSLVPPGNQGNAYKYANYAPYYLRKLFITSFNYNLRRFSVIYCYAFIDYYYLVSDLNGDRSKNYILDKVHLNTDAGKVIIDYTNLIFQKEIF